ncbi:MAG: hypothetical protein RMY28_009495 [Nostoc sp. ChiSLP01]|nr:hypothetical protein [Nostoc sp. CmiSLP01]MDZ8285211.1 hypothetical protein [Nostoc sp. ChiSLP01]
MLANAPTLQLTLLPSQLLGWMLGTALSRRNALSNPKIAILSTPHRLPVGVGILERLYYLQTNPCVSGLNVFYLQELS